MIWWIIGSIAIVIIACGIYSEAHCPKGGCHDWMYEGTEMHECHGEAEPTSYDMGGKYRYVANCKKYICKKCGQIKWEE